MWCPSDIPSAPAKSLKYSADDTDATLSQENQACSLLNRDPYDHWTCHTWPERDAVCEHAGHMCVKRNRTKRNVSLVEYSGTFTAGRMSVRCHGDCSSALPVSFMMANHESHGPPQAQYPARTIRSSRKDMATWVGGLTGRREVF